MNKYLFYFSLIGGLVFILEAAFFISSEGVKWYLIGMGQTMIGVGVIGIVSTRKQQEDKVNNPDCSR